MTGTPSAPTPEELERVRAQKRAKRQRYRANVKKRKEQERAAVGPPLPEVEPPIAPSPSEEPIAFIRAEGIGTPEEDDASPRA